MLLTEFWNRSIKHVYSLDGQRPGPGPAGRADIVAPDGRSRGSADAPYVLADNGVMLQAPSSQSWKGSSTLYRSRRGPWRLLDAVAAGLLRRLGARLVDVHVLQARTSAGRSS